MQVSDLSATDRCVMCGLCLPHCPTYGETRDEGDSPRGRIALMQALQAGTLQNHSRLALHLDRCLGCRACEAMCPSQVPFGPLMDQARHVLNTRRQRPRPWTQRVAADTLAFHPQRLRAAARVLRFYQRSGLRFIAQHSGLLSITGTRRLEGMLPKLMPVTRWRPYYPTTGEARGDVALFPGCIARVMDQETLASAIRVLNTLGYGVHVPPTQTCCGALHQHNGDLKQALQLAQTNLAAFRDLTVEAVLSTASGCGAQLAEYHKLGFAEPGLQRQATAFSSRVLDINVFLDRLDWPESVELAPLPARIAVHEPCTLRNILKQGRSPRRLLQRIPGIMPLSTAGQGDCCGAAGSYVLTQPAMADRLRDNRLDVLLDTGAKLIATANIGCALHLQAGLRQRRLDLEVIHPVVLIDRQLLRSS